MGDFNSILSEQEKFGGRTRLNSSASLFRQFLFDTGLVDLGFRGPAYTWTNCQHTSTVIFQRLDRILVSSSWSQAFPHAHVNHLPRIHSDHAPLLLRTHNQAIPKKKFKVERWWFEADGFRETCQNSWPSNQSLTWDYIITGMKKEIKEWSTSISTPQNRMTALKQDILKHQTLHPSMQNQTYEATLMRQYYQAEEELSLYWRQRAKILWHTEGDRNTAFFQAAATHRRHINTILHIRLEDGTIVTGQAEIRKAFVTYFKSIYCPQQQTGLQDHKAFFEKTNPSGSAIIPDSAHQQLISAPSKEEIKIVLDSMGPDK